jgi:hypothetical protein
MADTAGNLLVNFAKAAVTDGGLFFSKAQWRAQKQFISSRTM